MNQEIISIAKDFLTTEGGISGYTFWNELESKMAKAGHELSYTDWNELESVLAKTEEGCEMNQEVKFDGSSPMTGFEFTYRVGRRAPQTMRRFGWTAEEATTRFQRDMGIEYGKPVTILSVADVGYEVVRDNLPTPSPTTEEVLTLESVLINGVPDEATVYAKLVDGQFAPQSEAVIGSEAPDGFEPFGTGEEITEAMREFLWLDYDPDVDPEEYADFDMNYPTNNSVFSEEFLAAAVADVILHRNEED